MVRLANEPKDSYENTGDCKYAKYTTGIIDNTSTTFCK